MARPIILSERNDVPGRIMVSQKQDRFCGAAPKFEQRHMPAHSLAMRNCSDADDAILDLHIRRLRDVSCNHIHPTVSCSDSPRRQLSGLMRLQQVSVRGKSVRGLIPVYPNNCFTQRTAVGRGGGK